MVIKEKRGNLSNINDKCRFIDRLSLEWYETNKRILHRQTGSGKEVTLKFLTEAPNLQQDDVLYEDENSLIVVEILSCEAIVLKPASLYAMAYACYEIGNKHLPLFYENDSLLIPYEAPLFRTLQAAGFEPQRQHRKLLHPIRTTVLPHTHTGEKKESLFTKILNLTTAAGNE